MAAVSSSSAGPGTSGSPVSVPKQFPKSATSSTGTPQPSVRPGASVMTARGATTARQCAVSWGLHQRLPSTGTAPTDQIAHNASTQSGLL